MKMCIDDSHNLGKLDKVYLKEIFENRAFCLQKPNAPDLSDVVDKILDRCGGSPLAAKAFGSMLSTKTRIKEWMDVLTRSNTCSEKTGILPILKLSYDDLPSHLKQCFAFCAVFPKDYKIDVKILIQLWMAHDFIPLKDGDRLEEVGGEIFDQLTWRSFFQDVERIPHSDRMLELCSGTVCKIHDLMHDIALSVMGKDCLTIVHRLNKKELLLAGPTRHIFSSYFHTRTLLDYYPMKQSPAVQTLLYQEYVDDGSTPHLSKYNHLRALQLSKQSKLPLRPRHLQHLRYLDLSGNKGIKMPPKEIGILYNLQTLKLSGCVNLCQLPKDMKYMSNLRHLYTCGCRSLEFMPPGLGQPTSLQTTHFVGGPTPGCSTIRELRDLNLGGELNMSSLQYATEEHAKAFRLGSKEKLTHLSLEWSDNRSEELDQHRNVLQALKPHAALEFLRIHSYKSTGFPTWVINVTSLQHLTELCLDGCSVCDEFPQFGQFKALEVLVLKRLNKLQGLCSNNSSLKDLRLEKLENFERWVAAEGEELAFPLLEKVQIKNCPKLTTLPEAPKLEVITLSEYKAQLSLSVFRSRYMPYLSAVYLSVLDTEATPTLELDQNREVSLSEMELHGCNFLFRPCPSEPTVGVWKWFGQLTYLQLVYCDTLVCWPEEEFRSLVSLTALCIFHCSQLIGPTQSLLIEDCKKLRFVSAQLDALLCLSIEHCNGLESLDLGDLPLLETLCLQKCKHLAAVPGSRGNYSALQRLIVRYCPALNLKPLYGSLQQRLNSLEYKDLSHAGSCNPDEGSAGSAVHNNFHIQGLNYGNQNLGNMLFLGVSGALTSMTE
ncbi:LOW QUALITY PROTEIN: hypothetical protein CFC21_005115 [Triticum aestivum]|uniref:Uncharacterized protein n=2 Tax=Triticum aestivum TaxID=4565 RepID=A0A3B5YRE4_WHEAT|nr:LOW QUALITY PROTEIN: hypothetical protein CFC21_005115 [Triticum aestivum]